MYQLHVLNNLGQSIYTYEGDDLGEAIKCGTEMLAGYNSGAEYAYIIDTVIRTSRGCVTFGIIHKWFGKREENDDDN